MEVDNFQSSANVYKFIFMLTKVLDFRVSNQSQKQLTFFHHLQSQNVHFPIPYFPAQCKSIFLYFVSAKHPFLSLMETVFLEEQSHSQSRCGHMNQSELFSFWPQDWVRVITNKIQFWEFGQTCWEERSSLMSTGERTEPRDKQKQKSNADDI